MWLKSGATGVDLESLHANNEERRTLLARGDSRRGVSTGVVLLSVAVAIAAKGMAMQAGILSLPRWASLEAMAGNSRGVNLGAHRARIVSLAAPPAKPKAPPPPDEDDLKTQIGRGWVRRRDSAEQRSSSAGGPGMPLAASTATTPEDLKHHQFHKIMKQRNFKDFVVDARTGRPLDMTDEQKKAYMREQAAIEAKEEAEMDAVDPFTDTHVPTRYIYPDGEDIMPRPTIHIKGMSDRHVGADGKVTLHRGRVFGVFRAGAFDHEDDENVTQFGKVGEGFGLYDRPLPVRDVNYKALRERREKARKAAEGESEEEQEEKEEEAEEAAGASGNSTNATNAEGERKELMDVVQLYCSGKHCTEAWGKAGAGDHLIRLKDGRVVEGYEAVGPGGNLEEENNWLGALDRHIDPRTGEELPKCIGPQCKGMQVKYDLDLSSWMPSDVKGDPVNGSEVFGAAIPPNPDESAQDRLAYFREHGNEPEEGYQPPKAEPYAMDPAQRYRYSGYSDTTSPGDSGFIKKWDAASWLGFFIIGPILTSVVSIFIFMTRGPAWGLFIFITLVALDGIMFYFG